MKKIANDVIIGKNVQLNEFINLCGCTIGEGAVVGAGSVVTKDAAPNTIVAGNPTRVMKKRG